MERIDELQRGGYRLIQDPEKFCFGTDAVLLADFAKAKKGEKVLDLCSGTGVVPLLMLARYPQSLYTGLEIQEDMARMAARSMALNGVSDRVRILQGDLRKIREIQGPVDTGQNTGDGSLCSAADRTQRTVPCVLPCILPGSFQVVTVNPPYMKINDKSLQNQDMAVTLARHEVACTLADVLDAAKYALSYGGRFYMVHRPERLADIFREMSRVGIEPKIIQMVHPFLDKEAAQVLIFGTLGGRSGMKVLPPLITYKSPGVYTDQMLAVYGMDGHQHEKKS